MASQINPNNIDGTYPVAGQDNNTQGFRDNFTNIKLNFQFARNEISALQATSANISPSAVNDFGGAIVQNVTLRDVILATNNLTVSNVANVDYQIGSVQTLELVGNTNVEVIGVPAAGAAMINLVVDAFAANSVADPYTLTIGNLNSSGTIGQVGNTLSFPRSNSTSAGKHTYQLLTVDGGSTFVVSTMSSLTQPLNSSSENLANGGVVNLGVSDTYFSTAGASTATMPAGVNGQVKVLAMTAHSGNMVITVTNAGWKTSGTGTITFSAIGQSCTLKYINSKWYAIGNNGCTFG